MTVVDRWTEALVRHRAAITWVAVASVVGWPVSSHVPFRDLDRSWQLGLSLVHEHDIDFGGDVVFTYGPLGFAAFPMLGTGGWYLVAAVLLGAMTVCASTAAFATLRLRRVSTHVAGAITALAMLLAPTTQVIEIPILFAVGYLVVRLLTVDASPLPPWAWAAAGCLGAAAVLAKVSIGPIVAVALVALSAAAGRRAFGSMTVGGVVAFTVLWIATGQALGDLWSWLRGVASVSSGHVAAMSTSDPDKNWEFAALAVLVVGAIAVGRHAARAAAGERSPLPVVAGVVVTVVVGWFMFRQGFNRHATRSRLTFFALAWLIGVLMPWRHLLDTRRAVAVGVAAASVGTLLVVNANAFVAAGDSRFEQLNALRPTTELARTASYVAIPSRRDDRTELAIDAARSAYAIPGDMLDRIGSDTVHVDGTEIAATWAYDLNWTPIPTMQRYLGYTPFLDERNADFLRSDEAPRFILRAAGGTIDDRYPTSESPAYALAMFCRYRSVSATESWQLLERSTDRCGEAQVVETIEVDADQAFEYPEVETGEVLLMSIELDERLVDRIAELVLKPLRTPHLTTDELTWRLLPETAATPAIVEVPADSGWSWQLGVLPRPDVVSVDVDATVTFSTVSIAAS